MFPSYPYQLYEMAHAALAPARAVSDAAHFVFRNPWNPLASTALGKNISAGAELFERMTRRYGKPTFGLAKSRSTASSTRSSRTSSGPSRSAICLRFVRPDFPDGANQPKLLIVAPMSGHYATLLRGTVEAFLPYFDVYITDWADARMAPLGPAPSTSTITSTICAKCCAHLGPGVHTLGVCQPSVPLLAAAALMEASGDAAAPASMTLMGGPVDTRAARPRSTSWRRSAASNGSAATACIPSRFPIRASAGRSIQASCSSRASWR